MSAVAKRTMRAVQYGIVVLAAAAIVVGRTAGQGCAMCYQNAAAAGAGAQAGLRHGILILLIPALGIFGGIFAFIYRRRNSS